MNHLNWPWLELAVVIPLLGALIVSRMRDPLAAQKWCLLATGLAFAMTIGEWQDFYTLQVGTADVEDRWDLGEQLFGQPLLTVDEFSAPLLPLAALLFFLTTLATARTKMARSNFAWNLVSESIVLATFSCRYDWGIVALLALGTLPPLVELRSRGRPVRVYVLHMSLFIALMVAGMTVIQSEGDAKHSLWGLLPLLLAMLIRSGLAPLHCWLTDLFENASLGTALLFVAPLPAAYGMVRLIIPNAEAASLDWMLHGISLLSLVTAVYAAGMALVQQEARRMFCYLFLSHSALVLVGMELANPISLTGALSVWLSVGLSLAGFGLTIRAIEARFGRLSLNRYHGLYESVPMLAICFLLTGLASVGFPGTLGFVGTDLLVDGAVEENPYLGVVVAIAAGLEGIAVMRAYFLLFTGTRHVSSIQLRVGVRERFAVLTLAALILGGGLYPQPGIATRYEAAEFILRNRILPELPEAEKNWLNEQPQVSED